MSQLKIRQYVNYGGQTLFHVKITGRFSESFIHIANVGVHFLSQQSGDHIRILANYCRTHVHGTRLKIVYFVMYDTECTQMFFTSKLTLFRGTRVNRVATAPFKYRTLCAVVTQLTHTRQHCELTYKLSFRIS